MDVYWYPDDIPFSASRSITVGNFDGVHKGHTYLLKELVHQAETHGDKATVVTFTPHPQELIQGHTYPVLTPLEEQYALFEECGIAEVYVIPFTPEIHTLEAEAFYTRVIIPALNPSRIVLGSDHRFGYKGDGSVETVCAMGERYAISVRILEQYSERTNTVKTTHIKTVLQTGEVEAASYYLGRAYTLEGRVQRGKGFGTQLGFPTANVHLPARKYLPKQGVYVVRVRVPEHQLTAYGLLNIGFNPIVESRNTLSVEVYILDIPSNTDLYNTWMYMELLTYLRPERSDGDLQDLKRWIHNDIQRAKTFLRENSSEKVNHPPKKSERII